MSALGVAMEIAEHCVSETYFVSYRTILKINGIVTGLRFFNLRKLPFFSKFNERFLVEAQMSERVSFVVWC